jgi:hypothetical protein
LRADSHSHGQAVFDWFKAGRDRTLWYYSSLADVFERLLPGALADELREVVEAMRRTAAVVQATRLRRDSVSTRFLPGGVGP